MHARPAGTSNAVLLVCSSTQDELAKHTQRAASTIELQQQELGMLKERIRCAGVVELNCEQHGCERAALLMRSSQPTTTCKHAAW